MPLIKQTASGNLATYNVRINGIAYPISRDILLTAPDNTKEYAYIVEEGGQEFLVFHDKNRIKEDELGFYFPSSKEIKDKIETYK